MSARLPPRARRMKRPREYTLFALARGGPFTTLTARYPDWPWIYRVRAVSVRQAYTLAAREIFATDGVGVRELTRDGDFTPIRGEGP